MKNTIAIVVALVVFIGTCISCKNKNHTNKEETTNIGFNVIKLDPEQKIEDNFLISHIADSIEYIPLQTTDSAIIGNIRKIVHWNGYYYVLDGLTETIFCFDNKGKFRNKLQKKGLGPDEYYSITDFCVSKSGEIWVYSPAQAFLKYNITNNQLFKKMPTEIVAETFWIDSNDTINTFIGGFQNTSVFSDFPNQYAFIRLYNQKIISKSIPYKYHDELRIKPSPNNILSVCGDSISLFDYYDNKVYTIINGQLKPQYKISYLDDEYAVSLNNTPERNKEILKHTNPLVIFDLVVNHNMIWIKYSFKNRICSMVYLKKEKISYNMGGIITDDINNYISLPTPSCADYQGNLIGYVDPMVFKSCIIGKSTQHLKELKVKLRDTDNPVIIKMKMKKKWEVIKK